ncbi:putative peptidyl-prolyl cis-trans isomerase [Rubripirellula tenax]|uniref:peptidylprolyl isomerase n=1 Tax=Rubripirellula tenax TaxID=2528015 RepID=A0A5C6ENY2_9BACT|nr:peptidylprolyl isomerase [Rubripirellula tenax]TWU50772.1 putative peptidyl-prolyl cis-trans isomerase [Rubripirellula tenax]
MTLPSRRRHSRISSRSNALRIESLESRRLLAGDAPTFVSIDAQTVEVGSPLHVPIDAADQNGGPLTTMITVADPDLVEAIVITGNRSMRLSVADFGAMVFQMFEQRAPRASGRVIALAEAGFYDGVLFHRVDSDFVIQAGIAAGTTNEGSGLGAFDDEFHPDLQHNREGILSFAKSTDDTNDSQFFVTEADPRFLDFNHSIFGQLIEGFDVREAISETPIVGGGDESPVSDVVITHAEIFSDTENSLVMLRALAPNIETTATVTVTDAEGNATSQTFTVSTIDDQVNANPYLLPFVSPIIATAGETVELDLRAFDLESDAVAYAGQYVSESFDSQASLDSVTGRFVLIPAADFVGSIEFLLGVTTATGNGAFDTQSLTITFAPTPFVGSLALDATSDSGSADDDNVTNATSLLLVVDGVSVGTTVEVFDVATDEVLASATATEATVSLTIDVADRTGLVTLAARATSGGQSSDPTAELAITLDRIAPTLVRDNDVVHVFAGEAFTRVLTSDESATRWSLAGLVEGAEIDGDSGELTWVTGSPLRGPQTVVVQLTDVAGNVRDEDFEITVTSRYLNPQDAFDVDANGAVTAFDALLIINVLGRAGGTIELPGFDLQPGAVTTLNQAYFYNVSGDTAITALDALRVINEVGRRRNVLPTSFESIDAAIRSASDWDADGVESAHIVGNLF